MRWIITLLVFFGTTSIILGGDIKLPTPKHDGGTPLYKALKERSTSRNFSDKALTHQQISQVLWAAVGVNRDNIKKRTAPTAWGNNEITLYVLLKSGSYIYQPETHTLKQVATEDYRELGGRQPFVKTAPMTIVMVGELEKIKQTSNKGVKTNIAYVDSGYISQNIYLAAVSEGLITGARANVDKKRFAATFKLGKNQMAIIANSVGYGK